MGRVLSVGTKCSIPRLPEALVRRPRLEGRLANEQRRQVTLVSAPPGAGKTTLLTSWLASAPAGPVAWLTLDQRDGSALRLAELITVALRRAGVLDGLAPVDAPRSGAERLDIVFEHLLRRGPRCVLVLDDLQEAATGGALGLLGHLVEQAPHSLDIVLATRADPPLGWGRLRVAGRLQHIRNDELCFRPDEAAELFAGHGVRIGRDDTRVLCERTEGWAAGLRLAACALQSDGGSRRFVLSASATQVAVSDYLLTEVLDRQDEAAQQFLLRTSVVERLTPDLAMALTGDERAGERLAALERRGIFVVELDEDGSYRYHALFAALLRARLRLGDGDLVRSLHRRAARWHVAQGLVTEGEAHARMAEEWGLVGHLALQRWLDAALDALPLADDPTAGVPPAVVVATPELALVAAAQACAQGRRGDADHFRGVVDHAWAPDGATPGWPTARAVLDLEYGRAFGAGPRELHAALRLEDDAAGGPLAPRARRLAFLRRAEMDLDAGHLERAAAALDAAAADPDAGWVAAEATAVLAVVTAAAGRPGTAERLAAAGLAMTAGADATAAPDAARLALALCHVQRAEHRLAGEALAAMQGDVMPCRPLAAVHQVVRAALHRRRPGPILLDPPAGEQPMVGAALAALGVVELVDAHGRPHLHGGRGENLLAACRRPQGARATPAAEALERWLDAPDAPGPRGRVERRHPRTVLEANLLAALAADARGDPDGALRRLRSALDVLASSGIRAPVTAHADELSPLLGRYAGALGSYQGLALELADRLAPTDPTTVVDPLTDRELDVLRHLPTLMSNVEIAAGLHVSVNTVKSHLKAVYRKLGVEGRRQAVLRGRELELI